MIDGFRLSLSVEYIFPSCAYDHQHHVPRPPHHPSTCPGSKAAAVVPGMAVLIVLLLNSSIIDLPQEGMWETLFAEGLMNNPPQSTIPSSISPRLVDALKSTRSTGFPSSIDYIPLESPQPPPGGTVIMIEKCLCQRRPPHPLQIHLFLLLLQSSITCRSRSCSHNELCVARMAVLLIK